MRLDVVSFDCPKCKATLELSGGDTRIPHHFLAEQCKGVFLAAPGRHVASLTFRKLCRLSGAEICSLIGAGGISLLDAQDGEE